MIIPQDIEIQDSDIFQKHIYSNYNIAIHDIVKLGGYSNQTFKIKAKDGKSYVARVSHPHKSQVQISKEIHVLSGLHDINCKLAPKPLATVLKKDYSIITWGGKESVLQIFYYIEGQVRHKWFESCNKDELIQIFKYLAELHLQMAQLKPPFSEGNSILLWDQSIRLEQISCNESLRKLLVVQKGVFFDKAEKLTAIAEGIFSKSQNKQFIHGDIHLENLLFLDDNSIAFIDFENVQYTALEVDIIFSAFRICKIGKADDKLRYDPEAIKVALKAYSSINEKFSWIETEFAKNEKLWKALFCLDQAILYLSQAARGVWELEEGIGFLPCFNEVLAYEE